MPRKKKIRKVALYVRVSTNRQTVTMQTRELRKYVKNRGWTVYKVFKDEGFSGKNVARPAFSEMMTQAHQKKFDVLLVWKLDRLSRSVKDLVTTLDNLSNMGIDFVSYSDGGMDTTTPTGKLTFNVIATIAEFERDIISERVRAGLENAKAKGKRLGRPRIPQTKREKVKKLHQDKLSIRAIAKRLKIGVASVARILNEE